MRCKPRTERTTDVPTHNTPDVRPQTDVLLRYLPCRVPQEAARASVAHETVPTATETYHDSDATDTDDADADTADNGRKAVRTLLLCPKPLITEVKGRSALG